MWEEERAWRGHIFSSEPLFQIIPKSKELSYRVAEKERLPTQGGGGKARFLISEAYLKQWLCRILPPLPGALRPQARPPSWSLSPSLALASSQERTNQEPRVNKLRGRGGAPASQFLPLGYELFERQARRECLEP